MNPNIQLALAVLLSLCLPGPVYSADCNEELLRELTRFTQYHRELKVPVFDYSYARNFETMQDLRGIRSQLGLFAQSRRNLQHIDRQCLRVDLRYLYDLFDYEISFNLKRLRLEQQFKQLPTPPATPTDGLYKFPNRRGWYELYLHRWASREVTPSELLQLGFQEIRKVKTEIKAIQRRMGFENDDEGFYTHLNSDHFFLTDLTETLSLYEQKQAKIYEQMAHFFLETDIAPVLIKPIPDANADSPPGYYTDDTFFLNFYGGRHNIRSMDWLFIHEAVPGHHYHYSISDCESNPAPDFRKLFWYPGHSEGWAAYTEHLGEDLGLYDSDADWLGKWEWDLVRSARLVMDVGIHYFGWSDHQALQFWQHHIPNQNGIARREIARIRRWPGQVVSYKVGEDAIFKLKRKLQDIQGDKFDIRKFHHQIVRKGSMPLPVLEKNLTDFLVRY